MKNYTCDKCGFPMEPAKPLRVGEKDYDICATCHNQIFSGLEGKGINVPEMQRKTMEEIYRRMKE